MKAQISKINVLQLLIILTLVQGACTQQEGKYRDVIQLVDEKCNCTGPSSGAYVFKEDSTYLQVVVEVTRCDFELIEGNLSQVVSSIERFFPSVCEADELILKFRPKKPGIPSNYYYQRCAFVRSKE